ncbi:MAG: hypothetical protein C0616_08130 [Desulfuromonas sp.]|nr:MAG: hypothetical protein C0616_08130 [Desulfuromonas sp.]
MGEFLFAFTAQWQQNLPETTSRWLRMRRYYTYNQFFNQCIFGRFAFHWLMMTPNALWRERMLLI